MKTPVAVWDRAWDHLKVAPLREGGTHRGAVIERHQAAYVAHQRERSHAVGTVLSAATFPWTAWRVRIRRTPLPLYTWTLTAGEISAMVYPSNWVLAHTFGLVNGWVGHLVGTAAGAVAPAMGPVGVVAGAAAVVYGISAEHRKRRAALKIRQGAEVGLREDGELLPAIPLADAPHPNTVMEAVRRALAIEKVLVKPLAATPTAWGWEVTVQLKKGKPADVAAKTADLETLLDVAENGVLPMPHRDRRAQVTLRLVQSDPWADLPEAPDYTGTTRSIVDPIWLGQRLDGVPMTSSFAGKQSIILAASGGGKSILLRLTVDGLAACNDVHLWDLDPSGVGQAPQTAAMGKTALTPEDCETALAQALAIASGRTRLLRKLGMGDAWVASPSRPALVIVLDEFPRLTPAGKAMAVALLRIARKAGVVLIFASQDATKGAIGESIAGQVAFKAGGPGLQDWQSDLLFGVASKAAGWTPGRYKPATAQDQVNDAGVFYFSGTGVAGGDMALPSKTGYMSGGVAKARTASYVESGIPGLDAESLTRAGLTPEEVYTHTDDGDAEEAQHLASVTDVSEDQAHELSADDQALLAACVAAYGEDDSEWISTKAIAAEVAVGELGWAAGEDNRAAETRVGETLRRAGVASTRKTVNGTRSTVVPRVGLLAAAGVDIDKVDKSA
jgi:hypothetical protein